MVRRVGMPIDAKIPKNVTNSEIKSTIMNKSKFSTRIDTDVLAQST